MSERIRVLVLDDHTMVAESFRRVLDAEPDVDVVGVAHTAADAVAAVPALCPDVVLMDYLLPDGDGVTAAARIRALRPQTRVVLPTGSGMPGALPGALAAGCTGYVEKTAALTDLVPTVRAVAAGEVVVRGAAAGRLVAGTHVGDLTPREREVLAFVAEGITNEAIAARLTLSVNTVRTHVQNILAKLGAHSKLEAVATARRRGLV